jgi:hypothetical protein
MAQQILNAGESAYTFRTKSNSNFTELYTNQIPLNHASSASTYGLATTSLYGHIKVTTGNGLALSSGTLSLTLGTTSTPGAVQLVNNATTNDSAKAATAAALKSVKDSAVATYYGTGTPSSSTGKDGDVYFKIV